MLTKTVISGNGDSRSRSCLCGGVNEYLQANKLSNAVYDAKAIAAELTTLGFYVIKSYDIDFMNFITLLVV